MKLIKREKITKEYLPGRVIQKAVGKDSVHISTRITTGYAHYSEESGPMEPHHHAEEVVYIISARDGWVKYGEFKDKLCDPISLEAGMMLHFHSLEWHVFEFAPGGHVDIIFFYGQVENIRPEEIINSNK